MQEHKSIWPHKSFVSGVLAGHDNRVSCLGVTEVNVFVYIRGHPRKRILHRSHLHPNRMEEQLQLELGTGFFKSGTDFDWGNERKRICPWDIKRALC